jgi:hypothetical protein
MEKDKPTREDIETLAGKKMPNDVWEFIVKHGREREALHMVKSDKET